MNISTSLCNDTYIENENEIAHFISSMTLDNFEKYIQSRSLLYS